MGEHLTLTSTADDPGRKTRTRLTATFDWPDYDASEDIGRVDVPYRLTAAPARASTGTRLHITRLRGSATKLDLKQIRTASMGLISPLQSLIVRSRDTSEEDDDPGFRLVLGDDSDDSDDIAGRVLDAFELRARLTVHQRKLRLRIYTRDQRNPYLDISDTVAGRCGDVTADVRFFPRRAGAFRDLGIDGRRVYTWIRENAGVAVFDRDFRVSPYGEAGDDWLYVTRDAASNWRHPRSSLAQKHFPMSDAEQTSTADNWMLRLPESAQLIGVVQVTGARGDRRQPSGEPEGLVAAADREGFIANDAFGELSDIVRAAVEAIAVADRRRQKAREEAERQEQLRRLREQAAEAAREIESNKSLPAADKRRLLNAVSHMAIQAEEHERATRDRVRQLEVMSLLGVVAGFMTHEFGVALDALDEAHHILVEASTKTPSLNPTVAGLETARARLSEFMDYSTAYVRGSRSVPERPYPAAPRLRHVRGSFQQYALDRGVTIESSIARDVLAPRVPTSLYDGLLLNLLTNALKATTIARPDGQRVVSFRAWNEKDWHHLEVADTGIGIPTILRERVFDPLFTTTESNNDPLGSGMGLGLSLARASVEAFGGTVRAVDPPPGYSTCIEVRLRLEPQEAP